MSALEAANRIATFGERQRAGSRLCLFRGTSKGAVLRCNYDRDEAWRIAATSPKLPELMK